MRNYNWVGCRHKGKVALLGVCANKAVLCDSMAALALETLETQSVLRIGVMAAPAATLERIRASGD